MFTGLVEGVGELVERKATSGGFRLRIGTPLAAELKPGDSLAVNGVCLTVILAERGEIHADVGPETVRVTTLGSIDRGSIVNLERPLRADQRFGGHFVQGHVDAIGHIEDLRQDAEFHWLTVSFPPALAPFIVHKGSIAIDGISLTVAGLGRDRAGIRDRVNIECDMVGKYVVRAAELAGLSFSARQGEVTH